MTLPNAEDEDFDPDEFSPSKHVQVTRPHSNQTQSGHSNHKNNSVRNAPVYVNSARSDENNREDAVKLHGFRSDFVGDTPPLEHSIERETSLKKPRPHSASALVQSGSPGAKSLHRRPGSGRPDLRHTKGRTDTGMKFYPKPPKGIRSRPRSANQSQADDILFTTPLSRPASALNVQYLEDSDTDEKKVHNTRQQRSKAANKSDIVTLMSEIQLSGSLENVNISQENVSEQASCQEVGEHSLNRPTSGPKHLSSAEKNYYDVAMTVNCKKKSRGKYLLNLLNSNVEPIKADVTSPKCVKKTVKTIELLEDKNVNEIKNVSIVGTQRVKTHAAYVAPRPSSAVKKKRPNSAKEIKKEEIVAEPRVMPEHATKPPEHATKPTHDSNGRRIGGDLPPRHKHIKPINSHVVQVIGAEVLVENIEERPGSRLGFHVPQVPSSKTAHICVATYPTLKKTGSVKSSQKDVKKTQATTLRESVHHCRSNAMSHQGCNLAALISQEGAYEAYAHSSKAAADNKKINKRYGKDEPLTDVTEISMRKNEYEFESEGVIACRDIHDKLVQNGVPVSLQALTRGLLPPSEYGCVGPSYKTNTAPDKNPGAANLLSKPQHWLPDEYKKLQKAEKKLKEATLKLRQQQQDEVNGEDTMVSTAHYTKRRRRPGFQRSLPSAAT